MFIHDTFYNFTNNQHVKETGRYIIHRTTLTMVEKQAFQDPLELLPNIVIFRFIISLTLLVSDARNTKNLRQHQSKP